MVETAQALPPLAGLKVLDLSRVLAGPWCTQILADLGAEVIKIEPPGSGDDTRHWGPFRGPPGRQESAYFMCANRGKKSVAVDLATTEGAEMVRQLAATCDVLVENFKTGGLDKFGLGHADVSAANPRVVYCSISGYGRTGALANRAGYDYVIQAEGGLMAVTGEVDGEPMKVGVAITDLFTGMGAAQAVMAALIARDRDGVGQHLDMALYDSQLSMLANVGSAYLVSGEEPKRYGAAHASIVPYQTFPTADVPIVVAVGNDRQFRMLCADVLDRPDLANDERFATNGLRLQHRDLLVGELSKSFATGPSLLWLERLQALGVPSGAVRPVSGALTAPETYERDMVRTVDHPTLGETKLVGSPLKLSRTPTVPARAPPLLGEHSDERAAIDARWRAAGPWSATGKPSA